MSYVTNVLIWVSLLEGDDHDGVLVPAITHLNEWLAQRTEQPETLLRVDQHAGGNKHINCYLFAAGINYLDRDGFLAAFHNAPWRHPEMNMLVMRTEDDDVPRAWYPRIGTALDWRSR